MGGHGINCAHSPTSRDYCALTTCRNCRRKASDPLWATENPRLGLGVGVVGPGLRRRPVARVGWQAFFSRRVPRGTRAASGRPATRHAHQPTPAFRLQNLAKTAHPTEAGS